jgi:hypothetical protein
MDNTILSLDELKSRITSFYQEKKASAAAGGNASGAGDEPSETDPQETTPPTPVKDDGDNADLLVVPEQAVSAQNSDGSAENNIPDAAEASGAAPGTSETTDVTANTAQQKQDEAVDDPVTAKVANEGLTLAEKIKQRLMGKQAAQPVAAQPVAAQPVAAQPVATQEKSATDEVASDFDMNPNAYRKIAGLVLGYQEGRDLLDKLADREMGKQAAQQLIMEAEQLGAEEIAVEQQQSKQAQYVNHLANQATEEDVSDIRKMASVHQSAYGAYNTKYERFAYDAGAKQAAAAMDEADGMIPGDTGEEPSIEEIAEIIMQMVESGELDPALAEQILAELAGGGGGMAPPGAEGGMPASEEEAMAMAAGGGEIPPEAMAAMAGDPKMASSAKTCDALSKAASVVDQLFA